jgi:hypothetical protein
MIRLRSYSLTVADNLKVTDWTTDPPQDITGKYAAVAAQLKVDRLTASIDVVVDDNGEFDVKSTLHGGNAEAVKDYQALFALLVQDWQDLCNLAKH